MIRLFLFTVITMLSFTLRAQHRYEAGLEGGFLFPGYKLQDAAGQLEKRNNHLLPNGIGAVNLYINTPHKWVYKISAGFYVINYTYNLKQVESLYAIDYDEQLFLMASIGYAIPLGKKWKLLPLAGLAANAMTTYGGGLVYDLPYTTGVNAFRKEPVKTIFATASGSMEINYKAGKRIKLSFSANYMQGFSKRAVHDITYKVNGGPLQAATMTSYGSFLYFNAGIRYGFQ